MENLVVSASAETEETSSPEFCTNPACTFHHPGEQHNNRWYIKFGTHYAQAHGTVQRFRCKACGKTFSTQSFSMQYWVHRVIKYDRIESMLIASSGQRQIGRAIMASGRLVKNRCQRLARSYLALYAEASRDHLLGENCAFDGFESFVRSQYFPLHLNILVGCESLSVYGFTGSVLRRKGRMTAAQRVFRHMIDIHWKPARGSLVASCAQVFDALYNRIPISNPASPWKLWTDQHTAYPRALQKVPWIREAMHAGGFTHCTVSSRAVRSRQNPLFPVNYIDREIRKDMADHVRETVRFAREVNMAMQRVTIELGAHTFAKPERITGRCRTEGDATHAQAAVFGQSQVAQRMLKLRHTRRFLHSHAVHRGCPDWISAIWQQQYENPPVVDSVTGQVLTKRMPGNDRRAAHLLA
ncbi:hypothetical protein [Spirochaeta africana]|uniref:Uncharacterized protein n=1 Tax=Spirochaeta africana (strain ATCC 700263 / DSM 8902 / Z-7692) TaxID=889378 RepID=H9UK63_SPIAZ|nr:hypothetical protein [Spirochaeta africana]AFG37906.1 hypothetical protein Spiaf_1849 [Spirochaeta africana DSM 8902]